MKLQLLETVRDRIANSQELMRVCRLDGESKWSIARRGVKYIEEMILKEFRETDRFEVREG